MSRFNRSNYFARNPRRRVAQSDDVVNQISSELCLPEQKITQALRSMGISFHDKLDMSDLALYKELVCCKYGILKPYVIEDEVFKQELDNQLKGFDEVYVDTAPLIHEDWFMSFIANVEPVLRRRRKKLVILEKTMEELHGLKNNSEKDRDVRLRAQVRPILIRALAKKGLVKIVDTGSIGIADDHLISLFRKRGKQKDILLITQDRELSERVVLLQEKLNKNIEIPHYSFFDRLFKRHFIDEDIKQKVIACKLIEGGTLLRLYVCPRCLDSYYDKLEECEGFVICSSCYYDLKEEETLKKVLEDKKEKENEVKIEKKREELFEILTEKEKVKNQTSVGRRLKRRRRIIRAIIAIVLFIILAILYYILLK